MKKRVNIYNAYITTRTIFLCIVLVNAKIVQSAEPDKLLYDAIRQRGLRCVCPAVKRSYLLDIEKMLSFVDINGFDSFGNTPLMNAADSGDTDLVQLFIQNGADVNKGSKIFQTTPLMSVVYAVKKHTENCITRELLCKDFMLEIEGVALLLFSHGADLYKKNKYGRTALELADMYKLSDFASFLKNMAPGQDKNDEDFVIVQRDDAQE